jgi:ubiquinone/menaquinone biosynthesis C-methylase UbiE
MARIASRRLRRQALPQRAILGRAQQLPLASGAFRHVLSTFPDEYILAEETLSEIWRILQPGGSLIIVAMAEITGSAIYDRLAAWLFQFTGQTGAVPDAWSEQLRRAGFQPEINLVQLPRSQVTRFAGTKPA